VRVCEDILSIMYNASRVVRPVLIGGRIDAVDDDVHVVAVLVDTKVEFVILREVLSLGLPWPFAGLFSTLRLVYASFRWPGGRVKNYAEPHGIWWMVRGVK
jgi:hypothetical protein